MAEGRGSKQDNSAAEKRPPRIAGFEILTRVGRGGMGTVYRARQVSVDRIVAVKIMKPSLASNASFVKRFSEEARAAAKLNHPNIVQAIDAGQDGGYYYFAMEFVDGETLHRMMLREGIITEALAFKIGRDIARGLSHANTLGIVHRDIKPGNIMLTRDGVTKLCDLGLAQVRDEVDENERYGAAVGTPYYISPEQAMGQQDVDSRSDIYSLGATLYRAMVGKPAFNAPTGPEILKMHLRSPLPWPKDHNPELSEGACYVIAKMMAKKPEERYQTPTELIEDFERVLSGKKPKSSVVQLAVPPARLSKEEREAQAMTAARLRKKKTAVREFAQVRAVIDHVASEQSLPPYAVVRLLRGNLDENSAETYLKYSLIYLAERKFKQARAEFHKAAELGADVSGYIGKIDALGAPKGMAYIPGGAFISGSPENQTTVELPPFYIDTELTTNRAYHAYMRATGAAAPHHWLDRQVPEGQEEQPVVNLTWEEANAYAQWAHKRLPSAAEWEKAARGTEGLRYPWGNEFDRHRCNTAESGIGELTNAGHFRIGRSPYGCHDMIGNVVQWCSDEGSLSGGPDGDARAVVGVSYEESGEEHGCWRMEYRKRLRRSRKCGFRCALDV